MCSVRISSLMPTGYGPKKFSNFAMFDLQKGRSRAADILSLPNRPMELWMLNTEPVTVPDSSYNWKLVEQSCSSNSQVMPCCSEACNFPSAYHYVGMPLNDSDLSKQLEWFCCRKCQVRSKAVCCLVMGLLLTRCYNRRKPSLSPMMKTCLRLSLRL